MIIEAGRVIRVQKGHVLVETAGRAGCARCDAGTGCGGVLMGRVLGDRLHLVRALDGGFDGLAQGDRVSIGLHESALVRSAAMAYLVPLGGLFAGLLGARWLIGAADVATVPGALAGLVVGALAARILARRAGSSIDYQPVVVARRGPR